MEKQIGVTLISLTITIIVIMILVGITSYFAIDLIREAKLQDLKTNMLLIQAKAKEAVEEVNFQKSNINDESTIEQIKSENLKGTKIEGTDVENIAKEKGIVDTSKINEYYYLTQVDLKNMGLEDLDSESYGYFIIRYDIDNVKVEVINTNGYKGIYNLEQLPESQ